MANVAEFNIDFTDLKVLNEHLNETEDKIQMTAKSAKADFKKLQMAIDPVARATKAFKDQVLIAQKALATGAATQDEYADSFKRIQANAKMAGVTVNQFGEIGNVNARKMKRFGAVGMQQVGYQVQDFAVQVQGGTSAMVALGQQGSQLLGIFGPAGAIAGMILAIGTGLAGAFMAAKRASDVGTTSFASYKEAMSQAKDAAKSLKLENYMLQNSIKSVAEATILAAMADIKSKQAAKDAAREGGGLSARPGIRAGDTVTAFGATIMSGYTGQLEDLEKQLEVIRDLQATNTTLTDAQDASEAAAERLAEGQELIDQIRERTETAKALEGLEGRALFVKQQNLEVEKQLQELSKSGLNIDTDEWWTALELLETQKKIAIAAYDEVEAKKAAAQATRDAAKAEADRQKLAKEAERLAKEAAKASEAMAKVIGGSMESALMGIVDGTKSVKEAFKSMASDIIKHLYKVLVVQQMVQAFGGFLGKSGNASIAKIGNAMSTYGTAANGGMVAGGGSYLVGERGPEIFTPSMGGGHITPASQTNAGGVTIVQNINVSTGVQATVRAEIRQMMPQIANSAKSAVLDAKRRGGSYGSAFA